MKTIIVLILLLICQSYTQVKYVGASNGATMLNLSYGNSEKMDVMSAMVGYTKDGQIGIGAFYEQSDKTFMKGIGIQFEIALFRPPTEFTLGITMLGGFGRAWSTYDETDDYVITLNSQTAIVGVEAYFHTVRSYIQIEPFFQITQSFSKISSLDQSENKTDTNGSIGVDIFIGGTYPNCVVVTPGFVISGRYGIGVINLSFIHRIN